MRLILDKVYVFIHSIHLYNTYKLLHSKIDIE